MLISTPPTPPGRLFSLADFPFLEPISRLYATSPFDPLWGELERDALRWVAVSGPPAGASGLARLAEPVMRRVERASHELRRGNGGTDEDRRIYRGLAIWALFARYGALLQKLIDDDAVDVPFWPDFVESYRTLLGCPGIDVPEPSHLLALFYQARRAWYFAATKILGASSSAEAARRSIWRVNFARNVDLYARELHRSMADIPVLITGETGTGKEIAAECIAWSRYIPFDVETRRFVKKPKEGYHPWNACEVPSELVDSSLFGHARGAFTGALRDAPGFFGLSQAHGTLFLDEVGELPPHVQAKLLRPLQSRAYARVGEHILREILARLLLGTRCDLEAMCRAGTFRDDLLERMNGARVHMPPLRQMLAEAPGDLRTYVRAFVGKRISHLELAETWTDEVMRSIETRRSGYGWPRNVRELQHDCERALLDDPDRPPPPTRTTLPPPSTGAPKSEQLLGPKAKAGEVSLADMERAFVKRMYVLADQNVSETARRTGLSRKKVYRLIGIAPRRHRPTGRR